jgi:hypothetical protein
MMFYSIYDGIYVAGLSLCNVHVYESGYRPSTSIVHYIDEHWLCTGFLLFIFRALYCVLLHLK